MDRYEETFATWNKIAQLYQDKFMNLDLYDETYDRFCHYLPSPRANVLEVGCGPGNITRYLLRKQPQYRITGIDVAPNMIALAQRNNPTAEFRVLDARELDRLDTPFQGIVCGFCLPFLDRTACRKFLRDCHTLLTGEGPLYLSFVEGDYAASEYKQGSSGDRIFFHYYPLATILDWLATAGFVPVDQFQVAYPNEASATAMHTILIARRTSS